MNGELWNISLEYAGCGHLIGRTRPGNWGEQERIARGVCRECHTASRFDLVDRGDRNTVDIIQRISPDGVLYVEPDENFPEERV